MSRNVALRQVELMAIAFDMDGTLVDTEHLWLAAKAEVAARHGVTWTEADNLGSVGEPTPAYAARIASRGACLTADAVADEISAWVADAIRRGHAPWHPGALEMLAAAAENGIPTALVTMAYRPVAEALRAATKLPVFEVIVAGDDVVRQKPDAEPYWLATQRLGVPASGVVAVEDTIVGATSALAAGLATVLVTTENFPAEFDVLRPATLTELSLPDMATHVRRHRSSSR